MLRTGQDWQSSNHTGEASHRTTRSPRVRPHASSIVRLVRVCCDAMPAQPSVKPVRCCMPTFSSACLHSLPAPLSSLCLGGGGVFTCTFMLPLPSLVEQSTTCRPSLLQTALRGTLHCANGQWGGKLFHFIAILCPHGMCSTSRRGFQLDNDPRESCFRIACERIYTNCLSLEFKMKM